MNTYVVTIIVAGRGSNDEVNLKCLKFTEERLKEGYRISQFKSVAFKKGLYNTYILEKEGK